MQEMQCRPLALFQNVPIARRTRWTSTVTTKRIWDDQYFSISQFFISHIRAADR
jgi:hypothetical protein